MKQETTLYIEKKNGEIRLTNSQGSEWRFSHIDDVTAIAAVVFYTLKSRVDLHDAFWSNYHINFTIEEVLDNED